MSILPPKHSAVRVRLTQADRDVLVSRAQRSGVALSVVIRRAIRQYLNTPESASYQRPVPAKFLGSADGVSGA